MELGCERAGGVEDLFDWMVWRVDRDAPDEMYFNYSCCGGNYGACFVNLIAYIQTSILRYDHRNSSSAPSLRLF